MGTFKALDKNSDIFVSTARVFAATALTGSDVHVVGYTTRLGLGAVISASGDASNTFALANTIFRSNASASIDTFNSVTYPRSGFFITQWDGTKTATTSNKIFDVAFGISSGSGYITSSVPIAHSKEKRRTYETFARALLGSDPNNQFFKLSNGTAIHEAFFFAVKRSFMKDKIREGTTTIEFTSRAIVNTASIADIS